MEYVQPFNDNISLLEAAIYLEKGTSYDAFDHEQCDKIRFMCYLIVHTTVYKVIDVLASFTLLALAAIEPPAILGIDVPTWVHAVLEMSCLLLLVVLFGIKIKWQGMKNSVHHKRTVLKMCLIFIMFVEAVVVMIRNDSHVRVTRALRPLFLLDTHYFGGVRRVFREILRSFLPVLDILGLLFFFMVIFAMLGFYFFSTNKKDPNFNTYGRSFVSLFVLITTANYPDVMMPAYNENKAAVLFFVTYISVVLYFLMNLLLATVYSTFSSKNKEKFKRLYRHKREGARLAYTKIDPEDEGITLPKFRRLVKYYEPRMSSLNTALVFNHLDQRRSGRLNFDEFRHIYGAMKVSWRRNGKWFHNWNLPKQVSVPLEKINLLVTKRFRENSFYTNFDICIYLVIFVNGCVVLYEIIMFSNESPDERAFSTVQWYSYVFTVVYALEAVLKILALGPYAYFYSYWNWFDLLVTILNILGILDHGVTFAIYLRPVRLLLLFRLKKSYRVVFDTLRILLPSLFKMGIVILLFYYSFAIIGIEAFSGLELKSCCRNMSYDSEYEEGGYYYLNNFNNLFRSFVTLFELTVINNWHVIMEGFAQVTNDWSRIFFMVFYLIILVVMTIVVTFILEAFVLCIENNIRKQHRNMAEDTHKVSFETHLTRNELEKIDPRLVRHNEERTCFVGERLLTRDDLVEEMYKDELEDLADLASNSEASCRDFDDTLRSVMTRSSAFMNV